MSKTKESFVFYKDWWNAISGMPKEVRGEVCECVIRYAFGNIDADADAETGDMASMAMRFIAPQIDRDRVKYEATCKARQEAGRLGGAPKGNTNAAKQAEPTENNQNQAKQPDNDNETDNVNDNNNENKNENASESVCENGQNASHTHAQQHVPTQEEELFNKFQSWLTVCAPTVLLFQEPLNAAEFDWLFKKYGAARLKQCAADIHNKEAYLKNRNALNTFKLWIRNVKL